ncbi:DUF4328 domain-containing protein [Microbacterium sp. ASV49]|uniref:DUF4328 domain-containing protein n=1 Tax=Microbacterium candidum TaxID=3041922 RepID=A0ABT7MU33_9MICO|nr:DUF4328 domain-containing protein [Microbacterium sp. ASV49]MDL9977967.1 DUF4328 domain-containing protein [Microbacterium sp. ASV49]
MSDPVPPQPEPSYGPPAYPPPPQPQYGAPMYASGPGAWLVRPLRGIGGATRGLIVAYAALSGVTIIVNLWGIVSLNAYSTGLVGIDALEAYDAISRPVSILSLLVLLASGVCWMVWQYRAAASLPAGSLRRSPGWHVGSWFIPIVSLWFPFQNVSDIARSSRADLDGGIRGIWWVLWIAGNLTSGIGGRMLLTGNSLPGFIAGLTISIVSDALVIVGAVFAWIVVARITAAIDPSAR